MKKVPLFSFFILLCITAFSQENVLKGDTLSILVKNHSVYFNVERKEISQKDFMDSVNSQKYLFSILDTAGYSRWMLVLKKEPVKKLIGKKIPRLTTKDINGKECIVGSGVNAGLLVFWSITCTPCLEELTVLNVLVKEFPGLSISAITKERADDVLKFLEKRNYKWNNIAIIPDYKNDLDTIFVPLVNPATLILDKNNTVTEVFYGKELRKMVVALDSLVPKK